MSHPESIGRVPIGPKELLTLAGLIFTAGGGWFMLQGHSHQLAVEADQISEIQKDQQQRNIDFAHVQENVEEIGKKVEKIETKQDAMLSKQMEQQVMLQTILTEIKKGYGSE